MPTIGMRAGQLRKRITIQQATDVADGQGGFTRTWNPVRTCWAMVEPLGGAERAQFAQLWPTGSVQITMRGQRSLSVSPKMRIAYGTQVFEILNVSDVEERHRELDLLCEELAIK